MGQEKPCENQYLTEEQLSQWIRKTKKIGEKNCYGKKVSSSDLSIAITLLGSYKDNDKNQEKEQKDQTAELKLRRSLNELYNNSDLNKYEEFYEAFSKKFADTIPLNKADCLLHICGSIGDINKTHKMLQGIVPNWDEIIYNAYEGNDNSKKATNIYLLNCICDSALKLKTPEYFEDKNPKFLQKAEPFSYSAKFIEVSSLMEMLKSIKKTTEFEEHYIEIFNVTMSNQIAYLRWREENPHIKSQGEIPVTNTGEDHFLKIVSKNRLQVEKVAFEKNVSVQDVWVMAQMLHKHNEQDNYMNCYTFNKEDYKCEYIYTYTEKDSTSFYEKNIEKNIIAEKQEKNKKHLELIEQYANDGSLIAMCKTFMKCKNLKEEATIAQVFIETIESIDLKNQINKNMEHKMINENDDEVTTNHTDFKI